MEGLGNSLPPGRKEVDIPNTRICSFQDRRYTDYMIRICKGDHVWTVGRRFREFYQFRKEIASLARGELPRFPARHIFGSLHPDVVAERRVGLRNWLHALMEIDNSALERSIQDFLDPGRERLGCAPVTDDEPASEAPSDVEPSAGEWKKRYDRAEDDLKRALQEKDEEIHRLQREQEEIEAALEEKENQISSLLMRLEEESAEVTARTGQVTYLRGLLDDAHTPTKGKEGKLVEKAAAASEEIVAKNERIGILEREKKAIRKELDRVTATLQENSSGNEGGNIEDLREQLLTANESLKEKDAEIRRLTQRGRSSSAPAQPKDLIPCIQSFKVRGMREVGHELHFEGEYRNCTEATCRFQWARCLGDDHFFNIDGAVHSTYTPSADDYFNVLRVTCTPMGPNNQEGPPCFAELGRIELDEGMEAAVEEILKREKAHFEVTIRGSGEGRSITLTKDKVKVQDSNSTLEKQKYGEPVQIDLDPAESTYFTLLMGNMPLNLVTKSARERNTLAIGIRQMALRIRERTTTPRKGGRSAGHLGNLKKSMTEENMTLLRSPSARRSKDPI